MINTAFLICALAVPPALVQGVYHEPTYMALFNHLQESEWRAVHIRGGEKNRKGSVIFVGIDTALESVFKTSGWRIKVPPYRQEQVTMVFVIPPLRGNERGMARIIEAYSAWAMPGGFFVVQPFVFDEEVMDEYAENARAFLMREFEERLGGIKIGDKYYDVYQRKNRRSA